MSRAAAAHAWILHPEWLAFLGGYRVFNHVGTTWHYLADGPRVEAVGAIYKAMSRRRRAGDAAWHASEEARACFPCEGEALVLARELYERATSTLLAEGDLSLVVARRDGSAQRSWPLPGAAELRAAGRVLSRLVPQHEAGAVAVEPEARAWVERLLDAGVLVPAPVARPRPRPVDEVVLRATGHAGVSIASPAARVLVDPLLTLRYRPDVDRLDELHEPVDAVVITQAQWGHLDLDTLLRIDRTVPIYVKRRRAPASLDNVDIGALVRELGFTTVVELELGQPARIGDVVVTALPFRGAGLGPDSAADWMTLLVEAGGRRIFISANACADQRGSMDAVVRALARQVGSVHVVLAGYLDYRYPIAWFTRRPFHLGPGREQATTAPGDGVRWASMLGAEVLVPYAGFAWSEAERWRPPCDRVLYGGVVQHGTLARVLEESRGWARPAVLPLAPGGELRWRYGGALQAVEAARERVAGTREAWLS